MSGLKACPRCKGRLIVDRDHHGWYEQCLQCGYQRDLENVARLEDRAAADTGVTKGSQRG